MATHPTHRLVATARDISTLSYLPASPRVLLVSLDVTSSASIDDAISTGLAAFQRIDVLINNAGVNTLGAAEALPSATMRSIMDVNFWGAADMTRAVLPIMRAQGLSDQPPAGRAVGGGTILQVSSMGGRLTAPAHAAYHASKFALSGWTLGLASELAPEWGIRICLLEPGGVRSRYLDKALGGVVAHEAYADPDMVINQTVAYLGSEVIREGFAEADDVARVIVDVAMHEGLLPGRLPLGRDALQAVVAESERVAKEVEAWSEVGLSVGNQVG
jgi:NAD(P)-dependent dehydrogenase (short-subunit alcohol dehydrogenase family)